MPYRLTDIQLLVRTTPPNRSPFQIGGVTGKPKKRRPLGILMVRLNLVDEASKSTAWGVSGDRPSFGWLDKRSKFDADQKLSRLFDIVRQAREVYMQDSFNTPFEQWQRCSSDVMRRATLADHEMLSGAFASALIERAMIDAYCRLHHLSFFQAMKQQRLGFDPTVIGRGATLTLPPQPRTRFYIRHTIGLGDPLRDRDIAPEDRLDDGEPESLESYARRDGLRYFKVKISGDVQQDLDRLGEIWSVLASLDTPVITLDGNESYTKIDAFARFVETLEEKHLGLFQHIAFIEQPLTRN